VEAPRGREAPQPAAGLAGDVEFLTTVGLVVTFRCPIACEHCALGAGPHRTEQMTVPEALGWVDQIAGYRGGHVRALAITGGEPFCVPQLLDAVSNAAARSGLVPTVVTNAFWAESEARAESTLRRFPAIRAIGFSTDVHHLPFVPLVKVRHAVRAAKRLGLEYEIPVCTDRVDAPAYVELLGRIAEFAPPERVRPVVTYSAGRALTQLGGCRRSMSRSPSATACSTASAPMIFPDGRVTACIGPIVDHAGPHPLLLGSLRERTLSQLFDAAELNAALHAVRLWGPKGLVDALEARGLLEGLPTEYVQDSPCDGCDRLVAGAPTCAALIALNGDPAFQREVAWGRLHYLAELEMLARTSERTRS
jgi:radical SAM family protein